MCCQLGGKNLMSITKYEEIKIRTKNNEILWKNIHGIATEDTANIMDKAMLNWLFQECL